VLDQVAFDFDKITIVGMPLAITSRVSA
jgi:hypothetical protein